MLILGFKPRQMQNILEISAAMVSQFKANYAMADIKGLKLKYKASNRYLSGNK
ncbi:MAG: hypothetical protein F6K22_07970 [Okeania sp. SIO2F4]|uniref:hypothetical protein n=1 Tax=Okeania sp. SIO2F4 TaxID=2607790 RepID=UPI00142AAFEC|nr:hypothetical protein [Okeania sp. SIO2F4]NES02787.1 hypothetical protein [Okeania sp. SIO2F4]